MQHVHLSRSIRKQGLFFFLLACFFLGEKTAFSLNDSFHVCYFSLNNEKEYEFIETIVEKAQSSKAQQNISVREYLPSGAAPSKAFREMLETAHCDALVLSGHHTGSFGGKRGNGNLSISFLEDLVCESQSKKDWFSSIKSLWLQGCRTLGSNELTSSNNLADFHTARVGALIEEDALEASLSELNQGFSDILDESNPLSHRYRKLFPNAQIFGWTKSSPGEKAKSELSIPYHFAQLMKLNNNDDVFPVNIFQNKSYSLSDMEHFEKVFDQLSRPGISNNSSLSVLAWQNHGSNGPYAFHNTNLDAYSPLTQEGSKHSELLLRARELSCTLKKETLDSSMEVLDEILESPTLIAYNLKDIIELINNSKNKPSHVLDKILNKLKANETLYNFLTQRLNSKKVGLLRKLDYLLLMKEIYASDEKTLITDVESQIYQSIKDVFIGTGYENVNSNYMVSYKRILMNYVKNTNYNKDKLIDILYLAEKDLSPSVHVKAISIAGDLKDEKAWPIIENGLEDSYAPIRAWSLSSAIKYYEGREELALPIVLSALQDPSDFVRNRGMKELKKVSHLLRKEELWAIIDKSLEDTYLTAEHGLWLGFQAIKASGETAYTEEETKTLVWPVFQKAFNSNRLEIIRTTIILLRGSFLEKALTMFQKALQNKPEIDHASLEYLAEYLVETASCSKLENIQVSISEEIIKTAILNKQNESCKY